jgi:hypothetical protein
MTVSFGSQAVILPQISRPAAMRRKPAPRPASWRPAQNGQKETLEIPLVGRVDEYSERADFTGSTQLDLFNFGTNW